MIRGFSELYGPEVAGLVYIEAMDVETTRQELAEALPTGGTEPGIEATGSSDDPTGHADWPAR